MKISDNIDNNKTKDDFKYNQLKIKSVNGEKDELHSSNSPNLYKITNPFSPKNNDGEKFGKINEIMKKDLEIECKSLNKEHSTDSNSFSIIFKISDLCLFVEKNRDLTTESYQIYCPRNDIKVKFKINICVNEENKNFVNVNVISEEEETYKGYINNKKSEKNKSAKTTLMDFEDAKLQIKLRIFNEQNKRFLKHKSLDFYARETIFSIKDYINLEDLIFDGQTEPFLLRIDIESFEKEEKSIQNKANDYIGIVNEGSSCYMNSIIQILFHLPIVRKLIFDKLLSEKENNNIVVTSIQRTFYSLMTETSSIKISHLLSVLSLDKRTQQDAHEVFVNLLENIEKVIPVFYENFLGTTVQIVTDKYNDKEFSRKKETFCFIELPINVSIIFYFRILII